jgi:hypothetical protein
MHPVWREGKETCAEGELAASEAEDEEQIARVRRLSEHVSKNTQGLDGG